MVSTKVSFDRCALTLPALKEACDQALTSLLVSSHKGCPDFSTCIHLAVGQIDPTDIISHVNLGEE